jgi:hypothetical protein
MTFSSAFLKTAVAVKPDHRHLAKKNTRWRHLVKRENEEITPAPGRADVADNYGNELIQRF